MNDYNSSIVALSYWSALSLKHENIDALKYSHKRHKYLQINISCHTG